MRVCSLLAVVVAIFALTRQTSAVVIEQSVGRTFVEEHPKDFAVRAEKRDDGLIHFTITQNLSAPRYLVASFIVQASSSVIAKMHFPAFARDGKATYHLVVSPKHLPNAHFKVAERSVFDDDTGRPVPLPGGIDYRFQLAEFVPKDTKKPND